MGGRGVGAVVDAMMGAVVDAMMGAVMGAEREEGEGDKRMGQW